MSTHSLRDRHESSSSSGRKPVGARPVSAKISSRPLSAKDRSSSDDIRIRPNSALHARQQHLGEGSGSSRRRRAQRSGIGGSDELGGWETVSPEGHLAADFETSFEVTGWTGEEGSGKGSKLKPDQLDAENVAEHPTPGDRTTSASRSSRGAPEPHGQGEGVSSRTASGEPGNKIAMTRAANESVPDEQWYRRPGWLSVPTKIFTCPLDTQSFLCQRPTSGGGATAGHSPNSRPSSGGWAANRWDAKDWLWDADRESKAPMMRWKSSLCTVSPASEVYNRAASRSAAAGSAEGRHPSRGIGAMPWRQGKRPMTAAVNSRRPSTQGGRSTSRNRSRPHTAGARIEGQVPMTGQSGGARRDIGFWQVDEVDEEVSWGEEVQETSNSSQRMPLRESRGDPKRFQGLFYVGGAQPCEVDVEIARFREQEGGDGGQVDEHLLSVHHAMRVLMSGGQPQEESRPSSSWRRRL